MTSSDIEGSIKEKITWLTRQLERTDQEIVEEKNLIQSLERINREDGEWTVFNISIDNMDSKADEAIRLLMESGHAKQIKREVT